MTKRTFITQFTRTPEQIQGDCVEFTAPNKVKKSLSYATKIQTIYDNYCKTGRLPLNGNQPIYDENFIKYDNLIEAQQAVKEASAYFANLPTDIRAKYGNSLEKFVNAVHSQDDFLVKEGVLKLAPKEPFNKPVVDTPTIDTPVVNTPTVEPMNTVTTD